MTAESQKELMAAGATVGLVIGLLAFIVAVAAGLIDASKLPGMLAMVFGMLIGGVLGARAKPGSIVARVFQGIWFLVNTAGAAATLISLFLVIAVLLFSCS